MAKKVIGTVFFMELITAGYVFAIFGLIIFPLHIIVISAALYYRQNNSRRIYLAYSILVASCVLWIIVSSFLLAAVMTNSPFLIIPWLVVVGITILFNMIVFIISCTDLEAIIRTVLSIFFFGLLIYAWLGMISLFIYLKEEEGGTKEN